MIGKGELWHKKEDEECKTYQNVLTACIYFVRYKKKKLCTWNFDQVYIYKDQGEKVFDASKC